MKKLERLVISCGGTGGHFYPGLSIARIFKAQGGEVLLMLSGVNAASQKAVAQEYGIEAVALPDMPSWKRHIFRFFRGLLLGFFRSCREMKNFRPQAILGMGSFAMVPVLMAGVIRRIPLALHDGNARIGFGNRIFSGVARVLGAGFPPVNGDRCRCRIADVGMPVRPELLTGRELSHSESITMLNELYNVSLDKRKRTVLIFGGSQGAEVFNQTLPEALKKSGVKDIQVLHLCGKGKLTAAAELYQDADFPVLLLESSSQMELFLSAADMVFCRSGGSTLAELALFGKGACLIPYPYAAENHQQDNAEYFAAHGAARIVRNSDLTVALAAEILKEELETYPEKLALRNQAAAALARPQAAGDMLKEITAVLR